MYNLQKLVIKLGLICSYQPIYVVEKFFRDMFPPGRGQVQFQRFKSPLSAMLSIVIISIFLNRYIGQMNE